MWISHELGDDQLVLINPTGEYRAGALRDEARQLREAAARHVAHTVICRDARQTIVALESLEGWLPRVTLLPPDAPTGLPEDNEADPPESRGLTRWVLLTSGTTGTPKRIGHTKESLSRTVRSSPRTRDHVWGLLYQPSRMAGLQVIAQALGSGRPLVAPDLHWPLAEQLRFLAEHDVNALSATPTLWRRILQLPASDDLNLAQITLGGEISDQRILDALAMRFPESRLTHVFAATESGAAFAVTDGKAGFPVSYLDESPYGIRLAIVDGVLHVHAPAVQGAGHDGFVSTGDLVEVVDERVLFLGRSSGAVNIGGAKVIPEKVEELLRTHDAVLDARVIARPNPFSGSILVAEVVAAPAADPATLGKDLRAWVREQAPPHCVPAKVVVVAHMVTNATGKAVRTGEQA